MLYSNILHNMSLNHNIIVQSFYLYSIQNVHNLCNGMISLIYWRFVVMIRSQGEMNDYRQHCASVIFYHEVPPTEGAVVLNWKNNLSSVAAWIALSLFILLSCVLYPPRIYIINSIIMFFFMYFWQKKSIPYIYDNKYNLSPVDVFLCLCLRDFYYPRNEWNLHYQKNASDILEGMEMHHPSPGKQPMTTEMQRKEKQRVLRF